MNSIRARIACVFVLVFIGFGVSTQVFAEGHEKAPSMVISAININTADAHSLAAALHNIGPKRADAIVAYRKEHGPFTSKEQLLKVKGIGEATLKKNSSLIVL